ncbi:TetR/AcrR family transcriptional regulator [Solimonas flava]|uniref:TetR/AcrR family transcriptional regulator n=1 Tax=Solimonas flava TaxID=415849 RepID=UPI000415D76B|nr:TetR/AcrR family transcriptional regulator [Solimonas flava]
MKAMTAAQKRIHQTALRLFAETGSASITIKDLAAAAGMARGTVYSHLGSTERLFETVAAQLADEMDERIALSYAGIDDPARRLAIGVRLYIRRAHEEPHWGKFILHFGFTSEALRKIWEGPPMLDAMQGQQTGRYKIEPAQLPIVVGMTTGTTISAFLLVQEGIKTWREAGSDAAELLLRGLGISTREAKKLATEPLPELAQLP